jgi:hypothetical protein
MSRPTLHPIPLSAVSFGPGTITLTMSAGQWDALLAEAYRRGHTLLELDEDERPIAAYRQCRCDLCKPCLCAPR